MRKLTGKTWKILGVFFFLTLILSQSSFARKKARIMTRKEKFEYFVSDIYKNGAVTPDDADFWYALGYFEEARNSQTSDTITAYKLFHLAKSYDRIHSLRQARNLYQKFLSDYPDSPFALKAKERLQDFKKNFGNELSNSENQIRRSVQSSSFLTPRENREEKRKPPPKRKALEKKGKYPSAQYHYLQAFKKLKSIVAPQDRELLEKWFQYHSKEIKKGGQPAFFPLVYQHLAAPPDQTSSAP